MKVTVYTHRIDFITSMGSQGVRFFRMKSVVVGLERGPGGCGPLPPPSSLYLCSWFEIFKCTQTEKNTERENSVNQLTKFTKKSIVSLLNLKYRSFHLHLLSKISGSATEGQPHDLSHTCWLLTTPCTGRIVLLSSCKCRKTLLYEVVKK